MQDLFSSTLVPLCCCLPEQVQYRTPGTLVSSLNRYIGNGLGGRGNNRSTGRRVIDLERIGVQWTGGLLCRGFHVICIITYLSGMSSLNRGTLPLLHSYEMDFIQYVKGSYSKCTNVQTPIRGWSVRGHVCYQELSSIGLGTKLMLINV